MPEETESKGCILFVVSGSEDCLKARQLLSNAGLGCKVIDIRSKGWMPYVRRDLDITDLPALLTSSSTYNGIEEISRAIE